MTLAVVGSSGGLKAVFIQGVFNGLETGGLRADTYVGASASAVPAACAAAGMCNVEGINYTAKLIEIHKTTDDLGETMAQFIDYWIPSRKHTMFQAGMPRLLISASAVIAPEAAAQTQGEDARRLGRKLLVDLGRKKRAWFDENLALHLFDTQTEDSLLRITPDNICDVMYASLRMLHFARRPAWVDSRPYVDTSYTCSCPVLPMVEQGYDEVIVISTETGPLYPDLFQEQPIPDEINGTRIQVIRPAFDLESIGMGYIECTDEAAVEGFHHGEAMARQFLENWKS